MMFSQVPKSVVSRSFLVNGLMLRKSVDDGEHLSSCKTKLFVMVRLVAPCLMEALSPDFDNISNLKHI